MEELDDNPFYLALLSKYKREYEAAQAKGCCILIPKSSSLQNIEIDIKVIQVHIFKPSPYFIGQYISMFSDDGKAIQVEGHSIQKYSGYPDNNYIEILSEERGYSKDGKPFLIYVLERPIEPFLLTVKNKEPVKKMEIPNSWLDGSATPNLSECKRVLQELCNEKVLLNLDRRLTAILENYLFLPEYLEEAKVKLFDVVDVSIKEIMKDELNIGSKASSILPTIIESYIMSNTHCKLFPIICKRFVLEDQSINRKMEQSYKSKVSAAQLGANECFSCALPATVVELARLDSLSCPHEKRQCLKNAVDLVSAEIKTHLQETRGLLTPSVGIPCLTTDDLIPVLLAAVINSKLVHLASNLYYMENFLWNISTKDIHGFSLITFKAVVEFLKIFDLSSIKPDKHQVRKELSLEELMEFTDKIEKKNRSSPEDVEEWTPVDREMERLTKMIEASTLELSSVQHHGVQQTHK